MKNIRNVGDIELFPTQNCYCYVYIESYDDGESFTAFTAEQNCIYQIRVDSYSSRVVSALCYAAKSNLLAYTKNTLTVETRCENRRYQLHPTISIHHNRTLDQQP